MKHNVIPASNPPVIAQVAQLSDMSTGELKALWLEIHGQPPVIGAKPLLIKRLAYQLQVRALPKKGKQVIQNNTDRIHAMIQQQEKTEKKRKIDLAVGTVLTRFYQGQEHIVTVTEQGEFNYLGQPYKSLSVIAREITGTRWSGPAFFGVRSSTNRKKG